MKAYPLPLYDCQILTRYCHADLPYWGAFLEHYLSLGVTRFIICVQYDDEINEFNDAFAALPGITFLILKTPANLLPSVALRSIDLSSLRDGPTFTLMVDSDEFFYLSPTFYDEFRQLLKTRRLISLPWMMNCLLTSDKMNGFWGHTSKPLARTSSIKSIRGDHLFGYKRRSTFFALFSKAIRKINSNPSPKFSLGHVYRNPIEAYLIHYWGRSFNDVLIRGLFSRFRSAKQSDQDQFLSKMQSGIMPNRFKIYAYLLLHPPTNILSQKFPSTGIRLSDEHLLLGELGVSDDMRDLLFEKFILYFDRLSSDTFSFPSYPTASVRSLQQVISQMPDRA